MSMSATPWTRKDLLGLEGLSAEELTLVLEQAKAFKEVSLRPIKKVPALRGRTVVLFFLEPSTRTRTSFELAAKRLSADILNIQAASTSLTKGETIMDTVRNIEAMKVDILVIRHSVSGVPLTVAKTAAASVINAGDGSHEHPTQGLVDLYTILEKKGQIAGLNVAIVGDISHSRVARSNLWGLTTLGARVTLCGPPTLVPPGIERLGVTVTYSLKEAMREADVVMLLRLQLERQQQHLLPSIREYAALFGVNREKLAWGKPDMIVMHPGPVNRGVELAPDVADGPQSVIYDQVTNGVAVRMAVLYLVSGGRPAKTPKPAPHPERPVTA
ncbi:MAG: aspartate carbamoyltransferase catalytic subunit [Candidatus Omnitrophica bacterium]|nr:aspartate carbamoyltransferase catalytic subunit [Candidatus Omnitrophota bacterium]